MSNQRLSADLVRPFPFERLLVLGTAALLAVGYAWFYLQHSKSETSDSADSPSLSRLRSLESLVDRGANAIPLLVEKLSSPLASDRELAALGLTRFGPDAAPAVPALVDRLEDDAPQVRAYTLLALGKTNSSLDELAPRIVDRLSDPASEVRRNAAHALIMAGPVAAPLVLEALQQPGFRGVEQALLVLRHVAVDADATRDVLRKLVYDGRLNASTREEVLEALLAIGGATRAEVRMGLAASRADAFRFALSAVPEFPGDLSDLMPLIIDRLSTFAPTQSQSQPSPVMDLEGDRRRSSNSHPAQVLRALGEIGPRARDAIPEVFRLVESESLRDDFRLLGIRTLARLGADRSKYVSELVRLFERARYYPVYDRFEAEELGETLREVAPEQIPQLVSQRIPGLRSTDDATRQRTFAQFREFGPAGADAVPAAIELLRHADAPRRWTALRLLEAIGPGAAPALPDLAELLRQPMPHKEILVGQIANTVRQMGPAAAPIVPDLVEGIRQSGGDLSNVSTIETDRGALGALVAIGGARDDVVAFLRAGLSDPHPCVRLESATRLIDVDAEFDQVITFLVGEMEHPVSLGGPNPGLTCGVAARLLARIGPRAGGVMESVANLLESGTAEQQYSAAFAITGIAESREEGGGNHFAAIRAVEPLTKLLESKEGYFRRVAAQALGALGPVAEPAIPSLEAAFRDRRNATGYWRNPYAGGFSETDYVSPVFRKAVRSKYGDVVTVADEIEAALRKISADTRRAER